MESSTAASNNIQRSLNGKNESSGSRVSTAAEHVLDAAKASGKQVSAVAKEEISNLKADLEELVTQVPFLSDIDLNAAKDKLLAKILAVKKNAVETADQARQKINQGIDATEEIVKERPFHAIGLAAGIGILVGMLIARRNV